MENELISIIVPVYNVEKYIDKCINSITNQTYSNIEIIIINDGSTDNSLKICEDLAKNDKRIKLINTSNSGVSHARNTGINNCNGEYIIFVDSDDFIKSSMIETLYKNIKKYKCDISICNVGRVTEDGRIISKQKELNKTILFSKEEFVKNLYNREMINGYPVNKLIKKKCTKGIRFDESIKHLEDWDYLCRLSDNIKKVVYESKDFYYYYVNRNNSAVHDSFNESWITDLKARKKNLKYTNNYSDIDKTYFFFDYVVNAMNALAYLKITNKINMNKKNELMNVKKQYYKMLIKSRYLNNYQKIKLFFMTKCPITYFRIAYTIKKGREN